MTVEVLYFQGCPGYAPAMEAIQQVLSEEGLSIEVMPVEVPDEKTARSVSFPGSPTVRINGKDIEPPSPFTIYGLSCRIYVEDGVPQRVPSQRLIRAAIRQAANVNE
jgi:hypothetical protein